MTFLDLQIYVDRDTTRSQNACRLTIALESARPRSYMLGDVTAEGYAYLETDVKANIALDARLDEQAPAQRAVRALAGPYDDFFSVALAPASVDAWTSCQKTHTLRASETLQLVNSQPPRSGAINNIQSVDSPVQKLTVTLHDRACEP